MRDSFNDLSFSELLARRDELRKEYQDTRFNKVVGHIDNPLQLRTLRRKLSRLNTIVHEYDLQIRQVGAVPVETDSGSNPESEAKE